SSSIFYFPFDNDALTGEALTSLQNLIIDITNHKPTQIVINGHADRAGTDEYNISLSERRARFILDQLLAAGIDPGMVSYHAFGERSPQVTTANGTAEQANRRAEIFIE
ncbi:MAG: OmpA family protein, partial [Alphaproteobacteria bacterium]